MIRILILALLLASPAAAQSVPTIWTVETLHDGAQDQYGTMTTTTPGATWEAIKLACNRLSDAKLKSDCHHRASEIYPALVPLQRNGTRVAFMPLVLAPGRLGKDLGTYVAIWARRAP